MRLRFAINSPNVNEEIAHVCEFTAKSLNWFKLIAANWIRVRKENVQCERGKIRCENVTQDFSSKKSHLQANILAASVNESDDCECQSQSHSQSQVIRSM